MRGKLVRNIKNAFRQLTGKYEPVLGPLTYNQDGLATRHNCDFMYDNRFMSAYHAGEKLGSWGEGAAIHWRAYILCWAANRAVELDGDFVECGANKGGTTLTVIKYVDFQNLNKKFYLLDTFTGPDERYISETEKHREYPHSYEFVKDVFKEYPGVEIIKGAIPDTLPMVRAEKISYLHIDLGYWIAEIAAAEFFWEKLASNGIIIINPYGWSRYKALKHAYDEFASRKGVQVLALPTGQGLIVKP
jgi:O-methyltransferase